MFARQKESRLVATLLVGLLFAFFASAVALPVHAQGVPSPEGATAAKQTADGQPAPQSDAPEASKSGPIQKGSDVAKDKSAQYIYDFFIMIGGGAVWLGGMLLDTSIDVLAVNMGKFVQNNMLSAINELWKVIRDIFNLLFIFGLIYIGFQTILGDDTNMRRGLVTLIAAALLINFSLFFTKVIVDFSNVAAYQVYELLGGANATYQATSESDPFKGIAAAVMLRSQLNSYANQQTDQGTKKLEWGQAVFYGFMVMCMMLMAAFVFLAGSFMLISRFLVLVIGMILSPLLFLGMVFPQFSGTSKGWWTTFLKNAFVAPAYLFMVYLSLRVLEGINASEAIYASFTDGGGFTVFITFCLVIGFLYASLLVAQNMGGKGAKMAIGAAHSVRKQVQTAAGNVVLGGTAKGLRATVGRAAYNRANDESLKDKAANSWIARQRLKTATMLSGSSLDARQVGGVGKRLGIGTGRKGGFSGEQEKVTKAEKGFADRLGTVDDKDASVAYLKDRIGDTEEAIKLTKINLAAASKPEDKRRYAAERDQLEEELKKRQSDYKKEKGRRQSGSVVDGTKVAEQRQKEEPIRTQIVTLREARQVAVSSGNAERVADIDNQLLEQHKRLETMQASFVQEEAKGGYGNVVQNRGRLTSWITGRERVKNRNAGEEILKAAGKKVKQTKDDEHFQSLRDDLGKLNNDKDNA